MNRRRLATISVTLGLIALAFLAITKATRTSRSFDEIKDLVTGKTAAEVILILGEPDSKEQLFDGAERWIWWNYTYLEGPGYPPEQRGKIMHLKIVFKLPAHDTEDLTPEDLLVSDESYGIDYFKTTKDF